MSKYIPRGSRPLGRCILLAAIALSLPGCGGEPAAEVSGLSEEEFIEVIVALREAERAVAEEDSAPELFAARKAEILERHQTTEEEIRAFASASSENLQDVAGIWEEVSARLRRPMDPDSALDSEQEYDPSSPDVSRTDSAPLPTARPRTPLQ